MRWAWRLPAAVAGAIAGGAVPAAGQSPYWNTHGVPVAGLPLTMIPVATQYGPSTADFSGLVDYAAHFDGARTIRLTAIVNETVVDRAGFLMLRVTELGPIGTVALGAPVWRIFMGRQYVSPAGVLTADDFPPGIIFTVEVYPPLATTPGEEPVAGRVGAVVRCPVFTGAVRVVLPPSGGTCAAAVLPNGARVVLGTGRVVIGAGPSPIGHAPLVAVATAPPDITGATDPTPYDFLDFTVAGLGYGTMTELFPAEAWVYSREGETCIASLDPARLPAGHPFANTFVTATGPLSRLARFGTSTVVVTYDREPPPGETAIITGTGPGAAAAGLEVGGPLWSDDTLGILALRFILAGSLGFHDLAELPLSDLRAVDVEGVTFRAPGSYVWATIETSALSTVSRPTPTGGLPWYLRDVGFGLIFRVDPCGSPPAG